MKKHLYLYLFIFASLIALIFYINGRKYQEKLEEQVAELRSTLQEKDTKIKELNVSLTESMQLNAFTLDQNGEAEEYLYNSNLTIEETKQKVTDQLLTLNLEEGGNPLIPYIGSGRGFFIGSFVFINHKWVLVNFSDNDQTGDALIQYNFLENGELELETVKALIYL